MPAPENRATAEGAVCTRGRGHGCNSARGWHGAAVAADRLADDTARETGSSGDGAAEEGRAAGALDGLVERRLSTEEDRRGEAGRVGCRGLE